MDLSEDHVRLSLEKMNTAVKSSEISKFLKEKVWEQNLTCLFASLKI